MSPKQRNIRISEDTGTPRESEQTGLAVSSPHICFHQITPLCPTLILHTCPLFTNPKHKEIKLHSLKNTNQKPKHKHTQVYLFLWVFISLWKLLCHVKPTFLKYSTCFSLANVPFGRGASALSLMMVRKELSSTSGSLCSSHTPSPPPPQSMEQSGTGCTLLNHISEAQSLLLLIDASSWCYHCADPMAVTQPMFHLTKSTAVNSPRVYTPGEAQEERRARITMEKGCNSSHQALS